MGERQEEAKARHQDLWLDAPGWLGKFVRWNSANNGFPLMWHLLGGVVAVGAAGARNVYITYDSKPIWLLQSVVLVGRSGLGKGWIMSETASLIQDSVEGRVHLTDGAPTPEDLSKLPPTLQDGVTQAVPEVLIFDELSTALSKRDYMKSMIPRLTTLLQNGERPYQDPRVTNSRELKNLMWVMFGGSTEDFMELQMDPDALGGGFPSRALWGVATSTERLVTGRPGPNDPDERQHLALDLYGFCLRQGEIGVAPAADKSFEIMQRFCHQKEEGDPALSGYWSRKPRSILRLAGIAAVARDADSIEPLDLFWAHDVLEALEEPMMGMFDRVRSNSNEKLNLYALKRLIDSEKPLTFGQWFHDVRYKVGDKKQFEAIVENLKSTERVKEDISRARYTYRPAEEKK